MGAHGRAPAAFICEAIYGNAGGIVLPAGYLQAAYAHVRAAGGVCIADEVQVGYGRLGEHFWGFEQQGVVPDIVTIAKATGNGHPVAAVITTTAIADSLDGHGGLLRVGRRRRGLVRDRPGGARRDRAGRLAGERPAASAAHSATAWRSLSRDTSSSAPRTAWGSTSDSTSCAIATTREPAREEAYAICERLREQGAIVQPTGDGMNVLKIKPPLVIERRDVDWFLDDARRRPCSRVVGTAQD